MNEFVQSSEYMRYFVNFTRLGLNWPSRNLVYKMWHSGSKFVTTLLALFIPSYSRIRNCNLQTSNAPHKARRRAPGYSRALQRIMY